MDEEQRIKEALEAVQQHSKSWKRFKNLTYELTEDSTGDESLDCWVLLDNETTDDEITSQETQIIKNEIRENLFQRKVTRFPYVYFARESEYVPEL